MTVASRPTFVFALVLALGACSAPTWQPGDPSWIGEFTNATGVVAGRVEVLRSSTAYETEYGLVVNGLTAGQIARWRMHEGKCDRIRGTLGPASEIPDLKADDSGRAILHATIRMRMPESGDYSVRITDIAGNALMCTTLERVEPLDVYEREIRYP